MKDILFKTDDYIFSYRVAGILIHNNKILLQKPTNDAGFAFPGGHVGFGETNAETLVREFKEEIGIDIKVNGLKWVGEIFFPWGNKPCHQICLYYMIEMIQMNQNQWKECLWVLKIWITEFIEILKLSFTGLNLKKIWA